MSRNRAPAPPGAHRARTGGVHAPRSEAFALPAPFALWLR